jgi:cytochrome c oxidase subunit 3
LIIIFIIIQAVEYTNSTFTIADSVYGSIFFALTGLHGLHVMAAIILLSVSTFRIYTDQITSEHALSLDTSILYFHFTDVIWLILYGVLYYWGG